MVAVDRSFHLRAEVIDSLNYRYLRKPNLGVFTLSMSIIRILHDSAPSVEALHLVIHTADASPRRGLFSAIFHCQHKAEVEMGLVQ